MREGFQDYLITDSCQTYHGLTDNIIAIGCFAFPERHYKKCLTILKKRFH